ncbi:MAG: hypothetical protein WD069_18900 [Planctomycetales bacterium]
MKCHEFKVTLDGIPEFSDDEIERVYEAGCEDATLLSRDGVSFVMFDREADSFLAAVSSAVRDVGRARLAARIARIDADDPADQPSAAAINAILEAATEMACSTTAGRQ